MGGNERRVGWTWRIKMGRCVERNFIRRFEKLNRKVGRRVKIRRNFKIQIGFFGCDEIYRPPVPFFFFYDIIVARNRGIWGIICYCVHSCTVSFPESNPYTILIIIPNVNIQISS